MSTRSRRRRVVGYAAWTTGLCLMAGLAVGVAVLDERRDAERARSAPRSSLAERFPGSGFDPGPGSGAVPSPSEPRLGSVSGTVRDVSGRPVRGITVAIVQAPAHDEWSSYPRAMTDRSGHYLISDVPAGRHRVRFVSTDDGSRFAPTFNSNTYDLTAAPKVRVRHGRTTRGIDAELEIGGVVKGRIRAVEGGPTYATLTLERRGPTGWPAFGVGGGAGTDGLFTVQGLAPGTYRFAAAQPSRGTVYDAPGSAGVSRKSDAPTFEVRGGETARVEAVLGEPGRMVGRVVAPDGRPVEGATVSLTQDFEPYGPGVGTCCVVHPRSFADSTAADGTFEVVPEEPGASLILGVAPPRGSSWRACGTDLGRAGRQVRLGPGVVVERDLVLAPGSSVRGVITDQDGDAVARALVRAVPGRGAPCAAEVAARTDARGRYQLDGLAGQNYRLRVGHRRHVASWVGGGKGRADARVIRVEPGRTLDGVDHEVKQLGSVSGRVTLRTASGSSEGEDPRVLVCVSPQPDSTWPCATTEADGTFAIDGVAPGAVTLSVQVDAVWEPVPLPLHWRADGRLTFDGSQATAITVGAGEAVDGIEVELVASASVAGVAVDEDDRPLEWADVVLLRAEPGGGLHEVASVLAEEDGSFAFSHLPPGLYRFGTLGKDPDTLTTFPVPPDRSILHGPPLLLGPDHTVEDVRVWAQPEETSP